MAFFLSLSSGEFVGKDTGVESTAQDALLATFLHFGQPGVYKSMVCKNKMRNEGLTNRALPIPPHTRSAALLLLLLLLASALPTRLTSLVFALAGYAPLFAIRQSATHDDQADSDDEEGDASEPDQAALASVADVLAAVAFKALIQSVVLPQKVLQERSVMQYLSAHPLSEDKTPVDGTGQPKVDKDGKNLGPTAVSTIVFEATDGAGRDVLRKEYAECDQLLTELEESGKQGTPAHSYLCKRPESVLRTCVPAEATLMAVDDLDEGNQGLSERWARHVLVNQQLMTEREIKAAFHIKKSGEVRRIISAEAAAFAVRFATATGEVQEACSASEAKPLAQLESTLLITASAMLQETDLTQRIRVSRTPGWRAARRLEQLGLATVIELERHGRKKLLLLKRPVCERLDGSEPKQDEKVALSSLLGSLSPSVSLTPYEKALRAAPMADKGANLHELVQPLLASAATHPGVGAEPLRHARMLSASLASGGTALSLPAEDAETATTLRRLHAFVWALAGLLTNDRRVRAAAALATAAAKLGGEKPAEGAPGDKHSAAPPPPPMGPPPAKRPSLGGRPVVGELPTAASSLPGTPGSAPHTPTATTASSAPTQPDLRMIMLPDGNMAMVNVSTMQVMQMVPAVGGPATPQPPMQTVSPSFVAPTVAPPHGGGGRSLLTRDLGEEEDDDEEEEPLDEVIMAPKQRDAARAPLAQRAANGPVS